MKSLTFKKPKRSTASRKELFATLKPSEFHSHNQVESNRHQQASVETGIVVLDDQEEMEIQDSNDHADHDQMAGTHAEDDMISKALGGIIKVLYY